MKPAHYVFGGVVFMSLALILRAIQYLTGAHPDELDVIGSMPLDSLAFLLGLGMALLGARRATIDRIASVVGRIWSAVRPGSNPPGGQP